MRRLLTAALVSFSVSAFAQVQSRPTDAPLVTAEHEAWYVNGDPVQFAGNTYYRAGASVFFDGNRMVRTGSFNGVPLYADTTLEPFSMLFVPIGRGLVQPYERPRSGELAGTTGSRAPSFPVSALPEEWHPPMAPIAPTSLEPLVFNTDTRSGTTAAAGATIAAPVPEPEGEEAPRRVEHPAASPEDIEGVRARVWVDYRGHKWMPAGPAVPLEGSGLVRTGEYAGFPVFTRQDATADTVIYLPALPGLVTPYRLKP